MSDQPQKSQQQWLSEGIVLLHVGQYQEALPALEQAIRLAPDDAAAYFYQGNVLLGLLRYQEAVAAYEQAIRLEPNHAVILHGAYNNKGLALAHLGRYQEAVAAYEQAILLEPNHAGAYSNKGLALAHLGRYQEAVAAYEQAIRLEPNHAGAYYNKGLAFTELGQHQEALLAYEQAIRLNPNLYALASNNQVVGLTALEPQARLVVLATGRVIPLTAQAMLVGREGPKLSRIAGDGGWLVIPLPDRKMSTHHAHIRERQGKFTVGDSNSVNKTSLNGIILSPYQEYPLNDGDILRFADTEVRFVLS